MNEKPSTPKIVSLIVSLAFWILTFFFLIMALGFITSPVMLVCLVGCAFFSCPLTHKLPIKIGFKIRIPIILILFIVAGFDTPPYVETELEDSNNIEDTIPSDATQSAEKDEESISEIQPKDNSNDKTDVANLDDAVSDTLNEPEETVTEETTPPSTEPFDIEEVISEEDFKAQCMELWHDDVFFSDSLSVGDYVKLDLFLEEERFFNADSIYNNIVSDFINEHNLKRDFYYCGVRREDEISYMGGQLSLYFPEDCGYSASDMNVGDHLILYGEVIEFSTYTMDGYNYCGIIPRYIENNGQ